RDSAQAKDNANEEQVLITELFAPCPEPQPKKHKEQSGDFAQETTPIKFEANIRGTHDQNDSAYSQSRIRETVSEPKNHGEQAQRIQTGDNPAKDYAWSEYLVKYRYWQNDRWPRADNRSRIAFLAKAKIGVIACEGIILGNL